MSKKSSEHRFPPGASAAPQECAEYLLDSTDSPHVVVGPIANYDGRTGFIVATSERGRGFRSDMLWGQTADRAAIIDALVASDAALVIHNMASELEAIRLCEALWPGKRVSEVRAAVEAEHRGRLS